MSMLKHKRSIDDIYPIYNKTVLLRVDYNIPIKDSIIPKPKESRLRASLPTIRRVISRGGKAIVMSHLGRPTGHNLNVLRDEEKRKKYLKIWRDEKGTGKTTFFALCDGEEKRKILSWSSVAEEAKALGMGSGVGKTDLFASLEDEEKKRLLHRFQRDIHYGRNDNFPQLRQYHGFEEELTLRPVARRLEELLNEDLEEGEPRVVVKFAEDCMHAEEEVSGLEPGQVLLLENVRFYSNENAREESERMIMARKIASYGDYFVSDAFGTSHRNSATMVGIPKVMGHGCCGYLMKKEIEAFADVLGDPPRPMVAIVGGAKVSDKILLLEHILQQIDSLLIGGAMAYTFLKAQGYQIANSFHEYGQSFLDKYGELRDIDEMAQNFLAKAQACNVQVLLPIDHICHTSCDGTDSPFITENASVPDGYMALDIGPRTIELYKKTIDESRTAVWNGPMGVFEIPTYATGSFSIAKAMGDGTQERGLLSIIGGGASATAAERCGQSSRVSHVSGGGGASLDLLEGKVLPGINVLDDLE